MLRAARQGDEQDNEWSVYRESLCEHPTEWYFIRYGYFQREDPLDLVVDDLYDYEV